MPEAKDLPPLDSIGDDRARALWVLAAAEQAGESVLTPAEISTALRDVHKIALPRQRVQALLAKEKGTVAPRKKGGVRAYQIMQAGVDVVTASSTTTVIFVEPEQAFSKIRKTEEILAGLQGTLRVCDPYVDGRTLDFLAGCQSAAAIRLLTVNIGKPNPFARDLTAFNKEHGGRLEARVAAQRDLHDRYIIHDDGLLLLGASLNGLGKKQSFVIAVGNDLRAAVATAFESRWKAGTSF